MNEPRSNEDRTDEAVVSEADSITTASPHVPGWARRRPVRYGSAAALFGFGLFLIIAPGPAGALLGLNHVSEQAAGLVDGALAENFIAFAAISAVKAVVAMVEGSTVGVGFGLQVGDLIQPAYDYVDFIWGVLLYVSLLLLTYKVMLETGVLTLGLALVGAGLALFAFALITARIRWRLLMWGRRLTLFGVIFAYILPISLVLSNLAGERFTRPYRESKQADMERVKRQFQQTRQEFLALGDDLRVSEPGQSLDRLRQRFIRFSSSLRRMTAESADAFLTWALTLFLELLILPVLTGILLYWMIHIAFGRSPAITFRRVGTRR